VTGSYPRFMEVQQDEGESIEETAKYEQKKKGKQRHSANVGREKRANSKKTQITGRMVANTNLKEKLKKNGGN